jgi:hypothetical protein
MTAMIGPVTRIMLPARWLGAQNLFAAFRKVRLGRQRACTGQPADWFLWHVFDLLSVRTHNNDPSY